MTHARDLLGLDPKLVFDLAAQIKPPHILAVEYDLDPVFLTELVKIPHVKRLILEKRKELDEAGFIMQTKAKWMLEDVLGDMYKKSKGEGATLSGLLELAKFLRTLAGMDKQDATAAGEKFSVTINLTGQPNAAISSIRSPQSMAGTGTVIDVAATKTGADELPPTPSWLASKAPSNELAYSE